MIETRNFYIDGAWVAPRDGTDFPVYNPATEETFATISLGGAADAEAAISAARGAFSAWSMTTPAERGEVLRAIVAVYEKRAQDMAEAISTEMGAPIDMALTDQAGAGRSHLKAFIRALDAFQWEHPLRPGVEGQEMSYEPAGVAALITPWNWPMNQVVLKVGAALAAGCTMVLKPSEVAPISSILFSEIIHEAGVPAGVYNMVNGDGAGVGSILSAHPEIDVVSFTGSTRAGIPISKAPTSGEDRVLELAANRRTLFRYRCRRGRGAWRQLLFRQYRPVLQRGDPHACRTRLLRARRRGGEGHRRGDSCRPSEQGRWSHRSARLAGAVRQGSAADPGRDR